MELLIRDEDIVTMILEFLHSRKFYESAIALEKETGVLRATEKHLPDHLHYLRSLCLNGEWDYALYFLEPFSELDELNTKKLKFLVLKQKLIEIMHRMSANKACNAEDKELLNKVREDIQQHCTREELQNLNDVVKSFVYESGSLATFRLECFKELVEVLAPHFEEFSSSTAGAEWFSMSSFGKNENSYTRLDSIIADSLYLNECMQYCKGRALDKDYSGLSALSTKILENRRDDMTSSLSVLLWIRSLNDNDLFKQRFEIEDVTFRMEPITRKKLADNSIESPRKFCFASPPELHKVSFPVPSQPAVARNFSNNSNKNDDAAKSQRKLLILSPISKLNDMEKTTPKQVDEVILQGSEKSHSCTKHFENKHGTLSSNITDGEPLMISPSSLPVCDLSGLIKVEDSYEKFLANKKRQQTETELFLQKLEEREKRNQEIKKLLLQQSLESTDRFSSQKWQDANIKTVNQMSKSTPVSFKRENYVCIEYTEDAQAIRAVAFHPSGQVYAIGSNSKQLRICKVPMAVTGNQQFDLEGSTAIIQDKSPKSSEVLSQRLNLHKGSIYCAAWNGTGCMIATGSNDKLVKLLSFDILAKTLEDNAVQMSLHRGIVRDVTFMFGSNDLLASASADGTLCIADCNYSKPVHNLTGHTDQVLGLYSWHCNLLASASQDKCVRVWDIRTPSCVSIIGVGKQESCFPTSLCVDAYGQWMAMGLTNAEVCLYDLKAGKMALDCRYHSDEVRCLRFNPVQTNLLLSSSYDGKVIITEVNGLLREANAKFHCENWQEVVDSGNKLIQCKWHQNGDAFAVTSVNQTCGLWLRANS